MRTLFFLTCQEPVVIASTVVDDFGNEIWLSNASFLNAVDFIFVSEEH